MASAFPEMRGLDPVLPMYAAYESAHWMIGAGVVANRVFHLTDVAQVIVMTLGVAAFIGANVLNRRSLLRAPVAAHTLFLLAACVLLAVQFLWLRPSMDGHLTLYWDAAAAGDHQAAAAHQSAFNALHTPASRLIGATGLAALATIACAGWALASDARRAREATR
ncbi:MAG: hypothetical protein EA379_06625 [Phycisphaerales bacterium]|nr:MAG: hypothetical protein EA379_06625 [Phycisphaerales bacterium]